MHLQVPSVVPEVMGASAAALVAVTFDLVAQIDGLELAPGWSHRTGARHDGTGVTVNRRTASRTWRSNVPNLTRFPRSCAL
jgi:hypothetical protein